LFSGQIKEIDESISNLNGSVEELTRKKKKVSDNESIPPSIDNGIQVKPKLSCKLCIK
jgi:hypothetical protein